MKEAYCPGCKTTVVFSRTHSKYADWCCSGCILHCRNLRSIPEGYLIGHYTNEELNEAFVNLRKDPEYATKGVSMSQEPKNPTGALKFDTDKPRMELLDVYAMEQIALVMTFGARKYSANNWRQGFHWTRLIGAALRHLTAFARGEDKDPESGLSHLAHAGCCIMFLLYHEKAHQALDDRFKYEVK